MGLIDNQKKEIIMGITLHDSQNKPRNQIESNFRKQMKGTTTKLLCPQCNHNEMATKLAAWAGVQRTPIGNK